MSREFVEGNPYLDNGYNSRAEYLQALAEEHEIDEEDVMMLASLLGPNEDFDGLVTAVEDFADFGGGEW